MTQKIPFRQDTLSNILYSINSGFPISLTDGLESIELLSKRDLACESKSVPPFLRALLPLLMFFFLSESHTKYTADERAF